MKKVFSTLLSLLGFCFFLSAQEHISPVDTAKQHKTYKNNFKTQPLLVLPLTYVDLTYERALSKKTSLSLSVLYSNNHFNQEEYFIVPSFAYYFSKHKKNKYNRGFFAKASAPYNFGVKQLSTKISYQALYLTAGGGYQWIIGKRFVVQLSSSVGPPLFYKLKSLDKFGDEKWRNYSKTNLILHHQLGIGFTF